MNKKNKVSVIIPTYNSWETLKNCITSIQNQSLKPKEIIVIDNHSSDKTSDKVKRFFPVIKLVSLKRNTGVTGGRNKGIQTVDTSADYILFFDHDMVAEKNMLVELIKIAELDKNIGIVTPKINYLGNKQRIWSAGTGINLWTGQIIFRGGEDNGQYEKTEEVQVAPAAILVKRELLKRVKYFDDCYFATYEDTDFCFRAKRLGFKTFYAPSAMAFHNLSWNPKDDAKRVLSRAFLVGRNRVIFMKRFGKNFFIFSMFLSIYMLYYLLIALKINKINYWLDFMRGTIIGLIFIQEKYIPFSYINLIYKAIGRNVSTILDLGCGEGGLMNVLSDNEDWQVTGVDIYSPDLNQAKETLKYKNFIKGDLENVVKGLVLKNEIFDVVLCSQAIEHLPKENGRRLLSMLDKLAKKRIVISTPRGYLKQLKEVSGINKHQEHLSGWFEKDFIARGYRVKGTGLNILWSCSGLARDDSRIVSSIFRVTSFLISPLVYFIPIMAINLIAIKDIRHKIEE